MLLFGPWIWPMWVLRDHWTKIGSDYAELFHETPGFVVPLTVWVLVLSMAGLALIVLAFRWRS
ncbi:MAG: hypothetical protein NTY53_26380 [Kiritimatiellaeota bacterium]|nr:hypothetical protein [Kiritimatiellota bacterium]